MADTTSSEAPFPITALRENSDTEALGWASAQEGVHVHSSNPPALSGFPLTVGFAGIPEAYMRFGVAGDPPTPEDRYELAEHVHRTLWPKPAPKPIREMTEEREFREQASLLNGYVETICFGALYVGVAYREGYGAAASGGCARSTDAFRVALRLLAQKHDRYNPTTDTITEATDD